MSVYAKVSLCAYLTPTRLKYDTRSILNKENYISLGNFGNKEAKN